MLPIHLAPIQGQTDLAYRTLLHDKIGGVERYYTPFVRWEKEGLRNKDRRDIDKDLNCPNTSVQIIFKSRDEFLRLTEAVAALGWREIDLNMGCPFPLQTHAGRGAGLLQHTDVIEQIANEITSIREITFTAKMRIGQECEEEGLRALDTLDSAGLAHITIHPRLGRQQYKGSADREAYGRFLERAQTPILYNGDLTTPESMHEIERMFPKTRGLMIGRGLLARPTLAQEYTQGTEMDDSERTKAIMTLHEGLWEHALRNLQGDSQILAKMQSFWQPMEGQIEKKLYKQLTRCGSLRNYREAIAALRKKI